MLTRRHLLLAGPALATLAACGGADGGPSTGADARGGEPAAGADAASVPGMLRARVATALGTVTLDEPTDAPQADEPSWSTRLPPAARRVADVWGTSRPSGRTDALHVTVCADDAAFAAASDGLDADTAGVTTSRGVFLAPSVSTSLTEPGRRAVLAHELTHLWLGQYGDDGSSWWIKEGAAEWTAAPLAPMPARSRWPQLVQATSAGRIVDGPPPASEVGSELGYEWAHAYVAHLAERLGMDAVRDLVLGREDASSVQAQVRTGRPSFGAWVSAQARGAE